MASCNFYLTGMRTDSWVRTQKTEKSRYGPESWGQELQPHRADSLHSGDLGCTLVTWGAVGRTRGVIQAVECSYSRKRLSPKELPLSALSLK
jgi:hypothetical protein